MSSKKPGLPVNTHMDPDEIKLAKQSLEAARLDVEEAENLADFAENEIRKIEIIDHKGGLLEKLRRINRES